VNDTASERYDQTSRYAITALPYHENSAYDLAAEKTIQVILDYASDEIDLIGDTSSWGTGTHQLFIRNQGNNQNRTIQIEIE